MIISGGGTFKSASADMVTWFSVQGKPSRKNRGAAGYVINESVNYERNKNTSWNNTELQFMVLGHVFLKIHGNMVQCAWLTTEEKQGGCWTRVR